MDVPFNRVEGFEQLKNPGDGYWYFATDNHAMPDRLTFLCPCGCGSVAGVRVAGEHAWRWNCDLDKPTTQPSILVNKTDGCGWHGYLTDGVFKSC